MHYIAGSRGVPKFDSTKTFFNHKRFVLFSVDGIEVSVALSNLCCRVRVDRTPASMCMWIYLVILIWWIFGSFVRDREVYRARSVGNLCVDIHC